MMMLKNILLKISLAFMLTGCVESDLKLSILSNSLTTTAPAPFAGDIHWSNTVLLLRCENGILSDVKNSYIFGNSGSGFTPDSSTSKFGTESCYFDGNGYIQSTNNDFILDSMDYTVEVWVHPLATGFYSLIGTASRTGAGMRGWGITSEYGIMGDYANTGIAYASPVVVAANTWSHIAIVKTGGFLTYYLNGVAQATGPLTLPETMTSNILTIGTIAYDQNLYQYIGYMDEIRITKTARYLTDFIPSDLPFPTF